MSASETFLDERAARGTSGPILGMVLFVASEAMFFAALFGVYFSLQAQAKVWPLLEGSMRGRTRTSI